MSYYEKDPRILEWFDEALTHHLPKVRRRALEFLCETDCPRREEWLERALLDPDPSVAAEAVVTQSHVRENARFNVELFESDLATGLDSEDLAWEWEYQFVVMHDFFILQTHLYVWTAEEDDVLARQIASMRAYVGKENEVCHGYLLIVGKRMVTDFTRRPRTSIEAQRWQREGRPRYSGT